MYKGFVDTWQETLIFTVKRNIIQILKGNFAVPCPLVILKVLPCIILCMHSNILYVFSTHSYAASSKICIQQFSIIVCVNSNLSSFSSSAKQLTICFQAFSYLWKCLRAHCPNPYIIVVLNPTSLRREDLICRRKYETFFLSTFCHSFKEMNL